MKNKKLLNRAKKGDEAAVAQLYEENIKDVYRFVYYKVGSREDAEDITQDVMIAAFDGLSKFRGDASFRNWCYEIAKRKIADLWRDKYKMPTVDIDATLGIHSTLETAEDKQEAEEHDVFKQQQVEAVLGELKDNYRAVLEYRFLKNYSIKETAAAMEITVSNAKVLQHRALKKAAVLHPEMPLPSTST